MDKEKLLLHACCAPCAGYVIDKLTKDYQLAVYYYNPNIFPDTEYFRRRDELKNYCTKLQIPFIEETYSYQDWLKSINGFEEEPEKGKRCNICFRLRLAKTALYALSNNYKCFSTTLTVSPHKKSSTIIHTAKELGVEHKAFFLAEDFKKKNGYQISTEIAKREDFFRQTYCGCYYSM